MTEPLRASRLLLLAVAAFSLAGASPAGPRVINPEAYYPEGALVRDGDLYYAEMGRDRVMRFDGARNTVVWSRPGCGPTSIAPDGGGLIVLCHLEDSLARISAAGETLAIVDHDTNGRRFDNPNASASDGRGGVYFSASGTFSPTAPSEGAILHLARDGRLTRLAEGIHYANGIALSPDGSRLYVSEHLSRRILAFGVGPDGVLSGPRVFATLNGLIGSEPGRTWEIGPDGLATDRAGNLYIAIYGGGRFLIVAPDGRLLHTIRIAERYTTAVALSADESTLFLTAPTALFPSVPGKVYAVDNPAAPH